MVTEGVDDGTVHIVARDWFEKHIPRDIADKIVTVYVYPDDTVKMSHTLYKRFVDGK